MGAVWLARDLYEANLLIHEFIWYRCLLMRWRSAAAKRDFRAGAVRTCNLERE